MADHKAGCPAGGGYGTSDRDCLCGSVPANDLRERVEERIKHYERIVSAGGPFAEDDATTLAALREVLAKPHLLMGEPVGYVCDYETGVRAILNGNSTGHFPAHDTLLYAPQVKP